MKGPETYYAEVTVKALMIVAALGIALFILWLLL